MQGDCTRVIAGHGVVFDAALLFLVDDFQPLSTCRVCSFENEADLKLQNAIAVLATAHPHVWLHAALLLPRRVFEPFFVSFARSLMPVRPQFYLQITVDMLALGEYDGLG